MRVFISFFLLSFCFSFKSFAVGDGIYDAIKTGYVMSQAIIYDDNDNPTFVVYGQDGEIIRRIGLATGPYEKAVAMSASKYNAVIMGFLTLKEQIRDGAGIGARIITKEEYQTETFTTPAPNNETVDKPQLLESTKYVYVRGDETLISPEINPILFESPINIRDGVELQESVVSILLDEYGNLLETAEGNIGYEVAYFDNEDVRYSPQNGDKIHGPVSGVIVEGTLPVIGNLSVTNDEGKYLMHYFLPPCPGFNFEYNSHLFAQLRYRNFNPRSQGSGVYYTGKYVYDFCPGFGDTLKHVPNLLAQMAYVAIVGIKSAFASPVVRLNFRIDTMLLTGKARLGNSLSELISLGDTQYTYEPLERRVISQDSYDFDRDGIVDVAVLGVLVELDLDEDNEVDKDVLGNPIKYFKRQDGDSATHQAIYMSSLGNSPAAEGEAPTIENQPDFTRLADLEPGFEDQGLVSSISLDDLKNTDIYVFRVSNGDLITERQGIADAELPFGSVMEGEDNEVYYRILMRGPKTTRIFQSDSFAQWQENTKINPKLHQKDSDHLRPGEKVKIISINRATGYIGSTISELRQTSSGGDISFPIDDIVMRPPNLKVRATRVFEVEAGLTEGEEYENVISFEGAALKSDRYIKVETQWLDHDGSPLPEELDEYGYTGRLAKVVGNGTLGATGNGLAHFSVKPGYNLQLVRLSGDALNTEHFYVQMSGEPKTRNPDFETLGAGQGALQYRPKTYVPFKVPLFDEKSTLAVELAYNRIKKEREGQETPPVDQADLVIPEGVYQWAYRPEMQFSVFDLQVSELNRILDENNIIDIEELVVPSIDSTDSLVQILFDFVGALVEPLAFFNAEQQLVLALGEQEMSVSLDGNGQINFDNIEHLSELEPEDFLTFSLYSNSDTSNILWEYAFLLDVEFLNELGEKIEKEHEISLPKPVIILEDISTGNVSVSGNTASVTVTGKVYCDLADILEDTRADITKVFAIVENVGTDGFKVVEIPVSNDSQMELKDYLPFDTSEEETLPNSIAEMEHPFVGSFSKTISFDIKAGSVNILFETQNVIGNTGSDAIELGFSQNEVEVNPQLVSVINKPNSDRGVFNPVWVLVSDESLSESQIENARVEFFGEEFSITERASGKFLVDRPFVRVAKDFITDVTAPNVANVIRDPDETIAQYSAQEAGRPPVNEDMAWAYVANKPLFSTINNLVVPREPKHYKFAPNTTVAIDWWNHNLMNLGYEVVGAKVVEKTKFWGSYEDDADTSVSNNFIEIVDPDTGRKGTRFTVTVSKGSLEYEHKRLKVTLEKETGERLTEINPVGGSFEVVNLKTIVLAVDGLAYDAGIETINNGHTGAFKKIFEEGVNLDSPALSALPTITWTNWPGVFSGKSPKDTGWMGNSYFPRETTSGLRRYPVFSGGGGYLEASQQGGVASLGTMTGRSLATSGSIYDEVALALNKPGGEKLNARSVNVFYTKHSSSLVKMDDTYFGIDEYIGVGHDPASAEILDDSYDVQYPWWFAYTNAVGGVLAIHDALIDAEGSSYTALAAWKSNPDLDIMSIYLPGTDNIGHGRGNHIDMSNVGETSNSVSSLAWHAKSVTDRAVGRLLSQIDSDGYENAVLFALTADHGQKQYSVEKDPLIDAEKDKFYQTLTHKGEVFQAATRKVGFNILTEEMANFLSAPESLGGLGLTTWFGTDIDYSDQYQNSKAVFSPDGGVAHIYLTDTPGQWQTPPSNGLIKKVANLLYRESTKKSNYVHNGEETVEIDYNHAQVFCDLIDRPVTSPTSNCNIAPYNDSTINPAGGAFGDPAAIFVKVNEAGGNNFVTNFKWVKGITLSEPDPVTGLITVDKDNVILDTVDNFLAARSAKDPSFKWPAFKQRLTEMNHTNPTGSRTGDIFLVLNINEGYLAVNDDAEIYPGWHGGPTVAESFVPLIFGMPGNSFVNQSGTDIDNPSWFVTGYNQGLNKIKGLNSEHSNDNASDRYLRNWHLTPMLTSILEAFNQE